MVRLLAIAFFLSACGSDDVGTSRAPLRPEDFSLSLSEAEAAIAAHDGSGCLQLRPYVECRGCTPRYRLDPIVDGASVGPCKRSTFVAGTDVHTADAPLGTTFTWTCRSDALGGSWSNGSRDDQGALVCR